MNYIRGAYQYYKDLPPINSATLTGAIDVIVIERPGENGTVWACTPFHVRFGKLQILRPGEKQVTVLVNGQSIPYSMKIGDAGEAFFVCETEEEVPEELMTSPIIRPSAMVEKEPPTGRFGAKEDDASLREVVVHSERPSSPTEPEFLDLNAGAETANTNTQSFPSTSPPSTLPSEPSPATSSATSPSVSPPPLVKGNGRPVSETRLSELAAEALDDVSEPVGAAVDVVLQPPVADREPHVEYKPDIVIDSEGYRPHSDDSDDESKDDAETPRDSIVKQLMRATGLGSDTSTEDSTSEMRERIEKMSFAKEDEGDSVRQQSPGSSKLGEGGSRPANADGTRSTPTPPLTHAQSEITLRLPETERTRAQSLTFAPTLPYRPRSDGATISMPEYSWEWGAMPTPRMQSTVDAEIDEDKRTLGSGAKLFPVGKEGLSIGLELEGKRSTFELSLCGPGAVHGSDIEDAQAFSSKRVTYKDFVESTSIVHDPELVIRWNDKYITRLDSSPLFEALAEWRPEAAPYDVVTADPEPTAPSPPLPLSKPSTWTRWWSRGKSQENVRPFQPQMDVKEAPGVNAVEQRNVPNSQSVPRSRTTYVKTLRLTSDQLKSLNLKYGANTISFSLTSAKAVVCTARVFLWQSSDRIVVSDIDGTITKSDALGHLYTMIGRDWTHSGVAKLYTDICRNGYKIMYLTSRAIGQADSTRDYLKGINQNNYQLPEGPVIMSPDRLLTSLHREVIMKKPEVFKMACLRDIQRLFGDASHYPFYAGFGNRITDALSYRSVNIPSGRIFTIDSSGEVKMELLELAGYKSSYIHMTDLVDQMFPPVHRKWTPEFTDFNYWRTPMMEVELPDLRPPSPALSARSDSSSRLSRLRTFTLGISKPTPQQSAQLPEGSTAETKPPRPRSPLVGPAITSEYVSDEDVLSRSLSDSHSMPGSLPGSPDSSQWMRRSDGDTADDDMEDDIDDNREDDEVDEEEPRDPFEDDLLATGEMENIPFL